MSYFVGIWMVLPAAWTIFMLADGWAEDELYRVNAFWFWLAGFVVLLLARFLP